MKKEVLFGLLMAALPSMAQENVMTGKSRDFLSDRITADSRLFRHRCMYMVDLTASNNVAVFKTRPDKDLFLRTFALAAEGKIGLYDFTLGEMDFEFMKKVVAEDVAKTYDIPFRKEGGVVRLLESEDFKDNILMCYVIMSSSYDTPSSQFITRCEAICPVMLRTGEVSGEYTKYPLYWMKMDEIREHIGDIRIRTSDFNEFADIRVADWFDSALFEGVEIDVNGIEKLNLSESDSKIVNDAGGNRQGKALDSLRKRIHSLN